MFRKTVSAIMSFLALVSMLTLTVNIKIVKAGGTVGVKAGDWIKCTYAISGWPAGQPYPEWLRVEFLTVEGTNATVYVTMHMSDGTEQSDTMTVDVAVGGGTFQGLSGFVIPANCTTGDSIYITGYGNVAIAGETTRIYAGASRTVVYTDFSVQENQLTYYWDKQTGVMVESSAIYPQLNVTARAKATETNMWQSDYVWSETIYIRADGSITPAEAPIVTVDSVTYTFTDKIVGYVPEHSSAIIIERDNIVLDGADYTLQGTGESYKSHTRGIALSGRTNVTVKNTHIENFDYGIVLESSSSNSISGNNIAHNENGIELDDSSNNTISGNNITNNWDGIYLRCSSNNSISGNNITNGGDGIGLESSSNNSIVGNNITNRNGIILWNSSSNLVYHNNFIDNWEDQVYVLMGGSGCTNVWDDGCPSGGNYWSDYSGPDYFSGPFQNITGSDGIGDTPYVIDADNSDRYPLMVPWVSKFLETDLNDDGTVNIVDISIVAMAFGTQEGDENYNPIADLDSNKQINIVDISIVAMDYGKTV